MTTYESALSWVSRASANAAERSTKRRVGTGWLQRLWSLLLVLGGLAAITYAAWSLTEALGWLVGGLSAFALRSLVVWGPDASP